ncbi:unnamed protein product [Ectocarpus sp. CCAP 1310/34]|nr:unnamed protein product [Ectocarpus sp. CCAP 1310/34]
MTALCVAFGFFWLLLTLCRRWWLAIATGIASSKKQMESQLEEERAKWQREAEIATAAAVAACQAKMQLFFQSQLQEERRKAKLSMKKAVEASKKEALLAFGQMFGFWGLMVLVQKAGWRSWNYSVPAAMPFRLTDHVPSLANVTELLFFAHQRASSFPMASWPRFCSMTALCVAFGFFWLLLTLCRRWWLAIATGIASSKKQMESQLEEERAKWQREAEIATAAAVAACQAKMQLFFQSQLQEERRKAKLSMKKAVEASKKEALLAFGQMVRENREAKDGKWQKKLDGVEARLLGRVKDELGDTPATIASVRADVLQLTKQAADMPAAMEKAVMDEIFRSGTEQLEMGQAKLREEMARFQQETEEAMGNLTAKLNNVKENTDALGSGLLTVQNIVMKTNGRRIKKVLYRMEERAEESSRVWGEGPKLGPHFAHWKATKKQLKEDGGGDDDEGEEQAGGNLPGPPHEEGEQKEEQIEEEADKLSGPPHEEGEQKEGEGEDQRSRPNGKTRRGKRGRKSKKAVGDGEGDDSSAANGSNAMSGGGEGGQDFSAGT